MRLQRLASNAMANVANGAATAVFQLGMTAVMARTGAPRDLAVWSLAASLASLAPLLGCNLSTAVARRLASVNASAAAAGAGVVHGTGHGPAVVMAAAQRLARRLTAGGLALALLLGAAVPWLYPQVVGPQPQAAAATVVAFFAGSCWVVLAQPAQGWLVDQHRNWPIAHAGLLARGAALLAAFTALALGWPAWALAVLAGAALWLGLPLLRAAGAGRVLPAHTADANVNAERQALWVIALGFAAWAAVSAAIQGATVPLVAALAPGQAAPFFLAFTLVTVVVGAVMAASNALVAPIAGLVARGETTAAARLVRRASALAWLASNGTLAVVCAALAPLLALWAGAAHADATQVRPFLAWLAMQHGIRSAAIVPSIVLATGATPRTLLRAVLPEVAVAGLLAPPLAWGFGVPGLLAGLVAGAAVGTLATARLTAGRVLPGPEGRRAPLQASTTGLAGLSVLGWSAVLWGSAP